MREQGWSLMNYELYPVEAQVQDGNVVSLPYGGLAILLECTISPMLTFRLMVDADARALLLEGMWPVEKLRARSNLPTLGKWSREHLCEVSIELTIWTALDRPFFRLPQLAISAMI